MNSIEFRIFKQYPAFGEMLDELRVYGLSGVVINNDRECLNGSRCITEEQGLSLSERFYFAGIFSKKR